MKEGDFVNIEFTGRIKDTDEVFDTTDEEMAKQAGSHNPKTNYGPVPIVIGSKQVIPGMEDALKEMKAGEKKKVEITKDKAFGDRNPEMVKLVPMSTFKQNDIDPEVGRTVNFNEIQGKIMSIDGGRVKVDFNHPLAGKTIVYDIEVKSEIIENDEKVRSFVRYFTGIKLEDSTVSITNTEATVSIPKFDFPKPVKKSIANAVMKWTDGITKVTFLDTFEKEN